MAKSRYLEIYNFIKENIDNGTYPPEEKIPSENQLKDIFSVSRNTVRKAIELLSSNGYLSSVHGKGVFVIKKIPVNFLLGGTESFKEASLKNGLNYKTTVPLFESLIVDENLSKKTHFLTGEEVYHMIRIREINNEKVILDDNYFLKEVVDGLTVSIAMDSIYEFLEKTKGLKINGTQKIISIESTTKDDQKYLDLNGNSLVAIVKNFGYLENGLLFEYTESHHRTDKFIFSSFAKR
ncbi:trehalose operon repressor [Cetobacterium sp. ZWU0022]|uniref:trehalose operon repressor n=1 Tax=Cetobacterium sp. ZWU0022 TaxID=1340502 RepID=UPI0006490C9F|nr:trehalose operon repressor [Cetobacterium sp. ZWU0022]